MGIGGQVYTKSVGPTGTSVDDDNSQFVTHPAIVILAATNNRPKALHALLMSSPDDLHLEQPMFEFFRGAGKDKERCDCFATMVYVEKLHNFMERKKAEILNAICWRGHSRLFVQFIELFSLTLEDISGGKGVYVLLIEIIFF
jgi:hypothetical protein